MVGAVNRCWLPHDRGGLPLTALSLKRDIRELDLWCSSCMVALEGDEPIAVLLGCKRPPETFVHRIAVHPDHLGQGHGRHLLTSLSAKLAILGPPQLVAEIPETNASARALFEACGWREERRYSDVRIEIPAGPPAPPGVVVSVTLDDLPDAGLPAPGAPVSWRRTLATLVNRNERLVGLAVASGDRLEAGVFYTREGDGTVAIWRFHAADHAAGEGALEMVLREVASREHAVLIAPGAASGELPSGLPGRTRVEVIGRSIGYASQARPA